MAITAAWIVKVKLHEAADAKDSAYTRQLSDRKSDALAVVPAGPPPLPDWLEIRVARVEIDGNDEWDGPTPVPEFERLCDAARPFAPAAGWPGLAGLLLCELSPKEQRQTDPRDPDLRVLLEAPSVRYGTHAAVDSRSNNFDYAFSVPGSAIATDGFLLSVVDADTTQSDDRGQEIGSVRFTEQDVRDALAGGRLVTRRAGSVSMIEVLITAHDGSLRGLSRELDTADGGMTIIGFPVFAGDIVRIEAAGEWRIGTVHDDLLGTAGYAEGILTDSNLPHFSNAGHGAAVGIVGQRGWANAVKPNPCVRFVAEYSGAVWVGVNDRNPGDNRGVAQFKVQTRGAKAGEWRQPGGIFPCR